MPSQSDHPRDGRLAADIINAVQRVFRENADTPTGSSSSPLALSPTVEHEILLAVLAKLPPRAGLGSSDKTQVVRAAPRPSSPLEKQPLVW